MTFNACILSSGAYIYFACRSLYPSDVVTLFLSMRASHGHLGAGVAPAACCLAQRVGTLGLSVLSPIFIRLIKGPTALEPPLLFFILSLSLCLF